MTFLQGKDQNVWVWVMGDHQSDKTIEQMLEEEAERKAEQRAEAEVAKLRYSMIFLGNLHYLQNSTL